MTMQPYSIKQIYESLSKVADHMVLYLPRTSDLRQLAALVGDGQKIRVTHYCMYGASKVCWLIYIDRLRSLKHAQLTDQLTGTMRIHWASPTDRGD